jgi:hypothetical protein
MRFSSSVIQGILSLALSLKEYEMSNIVSQQVLSAVTSNVVATVVKLVTASDTVTLPRMLADAGKVVQVRRSGDPKIVIAQNVNDLSLVNLTGRVGDEILLLSHSDAPVPTPDGAGAN